MSKLNYLDYAHDINRIEGYLPKQEFNKLKDIFNEDLSKKEIIELSLEIMKTLCDEVDYFD